MNKYVSQFFGIMFQSQQTQQTVLIQSQPRPTSPQEWRQYWQFQGQLWRTEPEIDANRQEELNRRQAIIPDIEKGIYPFRGMKLGRADVEWLLATHENGLGPVDWSDEKSLYERKGLDLRGADLRRVNLDGLLLACMHGGLGSGTLHVDVDATALWQLRQAFMMLIGLSGNTAMLLAEGQSEAGVIRYVTQYRPRGEGANSSYVKSLTRPILGYGDLIYDGGQRLLKPWLQGSDKQKNFLRFLSEQFVPSQLERWQDNKKIEDI